MVAPPDQQRLDVAASRDLGRLLNEAATCIDSPSASEVKILERLNSLRRRLATERFQLAVLGQFKRGKSTVLNALLGQSVLPIGVVPVTAIPTFLESGATPSIRVTYVSGKVEEFDPNSTEALREKLTVFVTEEANPRNVLNVARVDVFLPAELLERGVVLIDTPGVGSTHRHRQLMRCCRNAMRHCSSCPLTRRLQKSRSSTSRAFGKQSRGSLSS